jgi:hypothetical protein
MTFSRAGRKCSDRGGVVVHPEARYLAIVRSLTSSRPPIRGRLVSLRNPGNFSRGEQMAETERAKLLREDADRVAELRRYL